MSEQKLNVSEYLQRPDVQIRIRSAIQEARSNVTMAISRAASLSGFSESRLREWEKRGLLQTERISYDKEGKGSTGHRQYSQVELEKLIIMRTLLNDGYTVGDLPSELDDLWHTITESALAIGPTQAEPATPRADAVTQRHLSIDECVETMDRQGFWRYFVSQALRISLSLICEDIPDTVAGLILPLEDRRLSRTITFPADLHQVGLSLVGWLAKNRSFYTFLDESPTFEYPTDFRVETFPQGEGHRDRVLDNVFIVLQRKSRPLTLSPELVETLQRLLGLLYARLSKWRDDFGYSMYSWLYQAHDLERVSQEEGDVIFNSLLERAIELGEGKKQRWLFSALLLPDDQSLPIQQQRLLVRAQTRESPYEIGVTSVDPQFTDSLSLKAFQSGQVIYFAETLPGQTMVEYQQPPALSHNAALVRRISPQDMREASTRSAIAIPLLGDYGLPIAVLYIASDQMNAFSVADQRILRVVAGMVEELLVTSQARHGVGNRAGNMVVNPGLVDTTFQGFASETDFITELETVFRTIDLSSDDQGTLSIIAVDLDNQSGIAIKYGNPAARNLSQQIGFRIRGQMRVSGKYASGKLFHLSADRFCLMFRGNSLEETGQMARQLKEKLQGDYRIKPSSAPQVRPALPEDMLELSGVTVHLGVLCYLPEKLVEIKRRDSVAHARSLIVAGIEEQFDMGKGKGGGDCIVGWDIDLGGWTFLQ